MPLTDYQFLDGTPWNVETFLQMDPVIPNGLVVPSSDTFRTKTGVTGKRWTQLLFDPDPYVAPPASPGGGVALGTTAGTALDAAVALSALAGKASVSALTAKADTAALAGYVAGSLSDTAAPSPTVVRSSQATDTLYARAGKTPYAGAASSNPVAMRTVRTLQKYLAWLDTNGVAGSVTEFGFPCQDTNATWPGQTMSNWGPVAEAWQAMLDQYATSGGNVLVNQWLDQPGQFAAIYGPNTTVPRFLPGAEPQLRHRGTGVKSFQAGGVCGVGLPAGFWNGNAVSSSNFFPTAQWYQMVANAGVPVVRLAFRWETVQPTLNAALNTTELARIDAAIALAASYGLQVILDLHNYGGYQTVAFVNTATTPQAKIGGPAVNGVSVTQAHLVDVWTRLSAYYKGNPAVYAYELMNEPQGLTGGAYTTTTTAAGTSSPVGATIPVVSTAAFPQSGQFGIVLNGKSLSVVVTNATTLTITNAQSTVATWASGATVTSPQRQWEDATNAVYTAIRTTNSDPATVLVPGYDFSAASRFVVNHPAAWITSATGVRYNVHHYWSSSTTSDADYAISWAGEVAAQTFSSNTGGYFRQRAASAPHWSAPPTGYDRRRP